MANVSGIPVWRDLGTTPVTTAMDGAHVPVVIVGGGPVGLAMALDIGRRGQPVIVLSRLDFISGGSKAICFAKRSLDIFDRLGIGDRIIEKGVVWNTGKVFWGDRDDPIYQFDMLPVKDQKRPGFVNIQQYYVESYLIDALAHLPNVELRWGHALDALVQADDRTTLTVRCEDEVYQLVTDWLIACDGAKSPTRTMMGLTFEGRVFEDNFLIADIRMKADFPVERWFWFDPPFNPGQSSLLHKQPDDVWRLDFQLGWDIDREAAIRPENVEPLVRAMLGDDVVFQQEWYSVYTFQCRRMARFVHDRVIFAGDAAHLVSPFGARGCNGGMADVANLCWKLDRVLKGQSDARLIDSYDAEATVISDANIAASTRSTDFMSPKSRASRIFRDAVLELASETPLARPFVNSGRLSTAIPLPDSCLNMPDLDDWSGTGVPPGAPALDAPVHDGWLFDQLGSGFTVLTCDVDVTMTGVGSVRVTNADDILIERYAMSPGATYLIRPDGYVAARWKAAESADIASALAYSACV